MAGMYEYDYEPGEDRMDPHEAAWVGTFDLIALRRWDEASAWCDNLEAITGRAQVGSYGVMAFNYRRCRQRQHNTAANANPAANTAANANAP